MNSIQSIHGGDLRSLSKRADCSTDEIIDFSSSINPYGAPFSIKDVVNIHIEGLSAYPDPYAEQLVEALAKHWGKKNDQVLVANGSNEIFYACARIPQVKRIVVFSPSYSSYSRAAAACAKDLLKIELLRDDFGFKLDYKQLSRSMKEGDLVYIGSPNNPSGETIEPDKVHHLIQKNPKVLFVIDEAFIDFCGEKHSLIQKEECNLIISRSFTKFFSIPGIRLGACISNAPLIKEIQKQIPEWSVNHLAQQIGLKCIAVDTCVDEMKDNIMTLQKKLKENLLACGCFHVYPSHANYFLCRWLIDKNKIRIILDALLTKYKIALRSCENFDSLTIGYVRIAVKSEAENNYLCDALKKLLCIYANKKS